MFVYNVLAAAAACATSTVYALDLTFAADIPARKVECFYFEINAELVSDVQIEFAVVSGGNRDINVFIRSPTSSILEREAQKTDGVFNIKPEPRPDHNVVDWAYSICLDNSMSTVSSKRVDVDIWGDGDEYYDRTTPEADGQTTVDAAFQLLINDASIVRQNFREIFRTQAYLRHRSVRHEGAVMTVNWKIGMWSGLFTLLLIAVPIAQVIYVRRILAHAGGGLMRGMSSGAGFMRSTSAGKAPSGSGISF